MWTKFLQGFLQLPLLGVLLCLVDGKGTFYGGHGIPLYGNRFSGFRTGLNSQHLTNKPITRHKNLCAYVVEKNVTCPVQDEVKTYVKADFTSRCTWGQKCPVITYRILHRPNYRLGLKKVTALEWRCCPGHTGEQCFHGAPPSPDITSATGPFPTGREKSNPGIKVGTPGVGGERLQRMEEDLRLLTQGLDTLKGVVTGLEERLRTSLQEDINKLLVFLLPTSPRVSESLVGFGAITDGTERRENVLGFGTLAEKVTEVRDELRAKAHVLEEVQGMVLGHDGQLKRLLEGTPVHPVTGQGPDAYIDEILNRKLAGMRSEIYDGFENRLTGLENNCDQKIGEVQQRCHQEHMDRQEKIQQTLDGTESGIRQELGSIQAQIQGLTTTDGCCGQVNTLLQRVLLLEESVKTLSESQRQLQRDLTEHNNHLEALIQNRVVGTEGEAGSLPGDLIGFRTIMEEKMKTLEKKVLVAVEELGNSSAPAPLEGQVVPALETAMESVRRMEGNMKNIQNQLLDLELLCTSSCSSSRPPAGSIREGERMEEKISDRLEEHSEQLDLLNKTVQKLLHRMTQEDTEDSVQGEITLLKVNINSVNRTLKGIKDSISFIASEVGQANSTWRQREHQLFDQVQGITKLVGHQATLLGAGERRLAQLKAELVTLRKQLAGDVQGCRSTAVEVQREVQGFDSRVSQVEKQCNNLGELAEHLEMIRAELERHSDWYLAQVNSTVAVQT
ncbi:EMILIN-3 [Cynoglossus semilaevis]|uniref:Elastin microfibril interfacer 3 n=1 Tax=Cynoglossus semilaevis TaxID=244447 RepID=A0A3P8X4K2_CYNSE|nr:EMILIN-3 [Cynoglossus semilaevis]